MMKRIALDNKSNRSHPPQVHIQVLENKSDERGSSYHSMLKWIVDFLGSIESMHIATTRPSFLRGNHFHLRHREALIVLYSGKWSFYWDSGSKTKTSRRSFKGQGAILIEIEPDSAHAVLNDGKYDLCLIAFSNNPQEETEPDVCKRMIFETHAHQPDSTTLKKP